MQEYHISNGIISSGIILYDDTMYISSGGIADGTVMKPNPEIMGMGGSLSVLNGGSAVNTDVNFGSMFISSGGSAVNTEISHSYNDMGDLQAGVLYVSKGGKTNSTTVQVGGSMLVYSGASALNIKENGGYVSVERGANYSFVKNTIKGLYLGSSMMSMSGNMATLHSGTTATSTTIDGGTLYVYDGGKAETTLFKNGAMHISSGGIANDIIVFSNGDNPSAMMSGGIHVHSGGTVNSVTFLLAGGMMTVSANMSVSRGGIANDLTFYTGKLGVEGTVNHVVMHSRGSIEVSSGGAVNDLAVFYSSSSQAMMHGDYRVLQGGVVNGVTLFGNPWFIVSGTVNDVVLSCTSDNASPYHTMGMDGMMLYGVASNTRVGSGGVLWISSGGVHKGSLQIEYGAFVTLSGGTIDFTVSGMDPSDDYLINNLALIEENTMGGMMEETYTITVSSTQSNGTYRLAQWASSLHDPISVYVGNTQVGTLTPNDEALIVNGVSYDLNLVGGDLTLTVTGSSYTAPEPVCVTGNFDGQGGIFRFSGNGKGFIYTANECVQVKGKLDTDAWKLVGAGDFNRSGTDGLLWQEKSTGNVYMQNDITSFDEITGKKNLLGVIGTGYEILFTGDFSGVGMDGVLMRGPATGESGVSLNYGLPVWGREADGSTFNGWLGALVNTWQPGEALKGDTSDLADINAKNYMYDVVSVGDYNGDGVDDIMLQNVMPETVDGVRISGSGDIFTFLTGDMDAVKNGSAPVIAYAGCASGGWEILGAGDFNGDGIDDTLLSDGTGVSGWEMESGLRTGDFWFGNLADKESIAGITDLNHDGTDDIVILNSDAAIFTGWLVKNGAVTDAVTLA